MLKQLESFLDFYYDFETTLLIVLVIVGMIYFIVVHLSKKKEHFADPNQPPVPVEKALPQIKANLQEELNLIDKMTGYYNNFLESAAGSKAENPQDIERAKKEVEQDMAKEAPGKIIRLPFVKALQEYLKTFTSAPEINRLYVAYLLLPSDINLYISTGDYLDKKGKQLYDFVASLGKNTPTGGTKEEQQQRKELGETTSKVQGSTGTTFGTQKAFGGEGFQNPEMPDCCTKNKVESLKLNPKQISALYYVSQTRVRLLKDSSINATLDRLADTYKKLNALQEQVKSGGGDTFAKIAGGQSPETALTAGFTDYNPKYAFLIR